MNSKAARELGIKWKYGKNTVVVLKRLRGKSRRRVIKHEIEELKLMRRGVRYRDAHRVANVLEKPRR